MSVAGAAPNADKDALPPRKPTFLARYPRKLKLVALALVVIAMVALPFLLGGPSSPGKTSLKREANVHSADKMAAGGAASQNSSHAAGTGNQAVLNDQDDHTVKMAMAPDPALTEDTPMGSLPRIGEDGRQPWQVYARPFNTADQRPRLAIVIADLGLARVTSDTAIARLPTNVTLAFDSQSPVVGAWCERARQDGHETLLTVPMEPFDYPRSDPGSGALLTTLPNTDNIERLLAAMRQGVGYVGITTLTGSRFTDLPEKMRPVLAALKDRGLMIFDARIAPHSVVVDMAHDMHVPAAAQTERIDQDLTPEAVDKALNQLEKDARLNGRAIGVTSAEPMVVEKLQVWLKDLPNRGIALAPVSAMVIIDPSQLPYRRGVGLCLFNDKGLVLIAERRDRRGAWQMPQGGVQKDEALETAALRELKEEIGTDKAEIIALLPEKLRYEFPDYLQYRHGVFRGKYKGQEQDWFALRFLGKDSDIDLSGVHEPENPEFIAWRWAHLSETPQLIVDFKRPVYERVVAAFSPIAEKLARNT